MNEIVAVASSDRFKISFKLALSMVMAYGFALWFDWDRPHWAALAIALISMSTLDESLAKGGQRLWGTLLAVPVSLHFIRQQAMARPSAKVSTSKNSMGAPIFLKNR